MSDVEEEDTTRPVLYILMRTDMDSMNAGKAMAQASHASNAFVKAALEGGRSENDQWDLFVSWKNSTPQGFGTVLVVGVSEREMNIAVETAKRMEFMAGIVNDPTYPLQDGFFVHHLTVDTCGYIFGDRGDVILKRLVSGFDLHP